MHHQYRLLKNIPVMISGHGTSGSGAFHALIAFILAGSASTMYLDAVHDAMAAGCSGQSREAEERDHQTADDKTDAVDGIRNRNCLQAAEDSVAAADDADDEGTGWQQP